MQTKNSLTRILTVAIVITLLLTIGSCKDDNLGESSNVIFPSSNISYSQHVQVLFNQACAQVGCHSQAETGDRLKLDTYENLRFGVRGLPVVVAGSPETSTLVFRIDGRTPPQMPLNRNALNQNQINGIRAWIAEGALSN